MKEGDEISLKIISPPFDPPKKIKKQTSDELILESKIKAYKRLKEELKDFDQRFSFYFDYGGSSQLIGSQKEEAISVIFERITQDIFNVSLANW